MQLIDFWYIVFIVCMYGYVCVAMHVWLCMYGYICMAMYVWLFMYGYLCMATYVWLCMYGCMYGYVNMAMYVFSDRDDLVKFDPSLWLFSKSNHTPST